MIAECEFVVAGMAQSAEGDDIAFPARMQLDRLKTPIAP